MLLAGLAVAATGAVGATRTSSFTVTSTLDGRAVLPHRIHWLAQPTLQPSAIRSVTFAVDGRTLWVEHHAPYTFGSDGNYLVTSFLKPGLHRFTVRAVSTTGRRAADTVEARVLPAPPPPRALTGTWRAFVPQNTKHLPSPRSGYWRLVVSSVGWRIYDTEGGGNLLDVAYLAPSLLEVRTGMVSGHPRIDLNGWCNDEPRSPARYRWSVTGRGLQFAFAGGRPCRGFTAFLVRLDSASPARWTRVG